jgi:hypothetical protein
LEKWPAAIFQTSASLPLAKGATFASCATVSSWALGPTSSWRAQGIAKPPATVSMSLGAVYSYHTCLFLLVGAEA